MRQPPNVDVIFTHLQVADFMEDRAMVEHEAAALGRACFAAGRSGAADALGGAVLALPHHLLHAAFSALLTDRELPDLLDTLPAALHCALLTAHAQDGSGREFETDFGDTDSDARIGHSGDGGRVSDGCTEQTRCLVLRHEGYTVSAQGALFACIPHMPPLGALVCRAQLPAAELMPALAAHSRLTRLDLADTARGGAELVVRVLSSTLSSWPRLASLRLEQRMSFSAPAIAVISDVLAPALSQMTALTSLDVSGMLVTPELARAVGALTQLAELHLKDSFSLQGAMPDCTSLSQLSTFCGPSALSDDQPAHLAALRGIAACGLLLHLELCDDLTPGYDIAGLELAMLPLLESLRLSYLHDSSLQQPASATPFAVNDPACRCGVRALPHLLQLTSLLIRGFVWAFEGEHPSLYSALEACALGAALPLLTRLSCLNLCNCFCAPLGYRALAAGWSCAPALRALTCITHSDVTLLHGAHASAMQLRGLTLLDVTIERSDDDAAEERIDDVPVAHLSWLSGQVARLPALRALCINFDNDDLRLAALPPPAALSAVTGLRRLDLSNADLTGVDWDAMTLCALTALCLWNCRALHAMLAVAQRTELRRLKLHTCAVLPSDVSAFVQQRGRVLECMLLPPPHLDLDLSGEYRAVTDAVLEELLGAAERLGLRRVRVAHTTASRATSTRGQSAMNAVAAFNKRWGRLRKCIVF